MSNNKKPSDYAGVSEEHRQQVISRYYKCLEPVLGGGYMFSPIGAYSISAEELHIIADYMNEKEEQEEAEYRAMDSNDEPILPPEPEQYSSDPSSKGWHSVPEPPEPVDMESEHYSRTMSYEQWMESEPEPPEPVDIESEHYSRTLYPEGCEWSEPEEFEEQDKGGMNENIWTTLDGVEHDINCEPFCRFTEEELERIVEIELISESIIGSIFEILSEKISETKQGDFSLRNYLKILVELEKL